MATIKLTRGMVTLVDDEDGNWLQQWKWSYSTVGYAVRGERRDGSNKMCYMHRIILGAERGECCDHINGDKLDNRRSNLRLCSHSLNHINKPKQSNNSSGYKGVSLDKKRGLWRASFQYRGVRFDCGFFRIKEDAARAYFRTVREVFAGKPLHNLGETL